MPDAKKYVSKINMPVSGSTVTVYVKDDEAPHNLTIDTLDENVDLSAIPASDINALFGKE